MALLVYSYAPPCTNIVMPGLSDGLKIPHFLGISACGPVPGASCYRFSFCLSPDALLAAAAVVLRPPLLPPRQDIPRRCRPHPCLGLCGLFSLSTPAMLAPSLPRPRLRTPPPSSSAAVTSAAPLAVAWAGGYKKVNCRLLAVALTACVAAVYCCYCRYARPPPPPHFFALHTLGEALLPLAPRAAGAIGFALP